MSGVRETGRSPRLNTEALSYAKEKKGRLRGFQTGVAVMPVLASGTVAPGAIAMAQSRPTRGFAAFLMPAIVDLSTGGSYFYDGRIIFGAVYSHWLRERMTRVLATTRSNPHESQ